MKGKNVASNMKVLQNVLTVAFVKFLVRHLTHLSGLPFLSVLNYFNYYCLTACEEESNCSFLKVPLSIVELTCQKTWV